MGLLSSARRRRQEKKAIYKAAKVRAKAEAKSTGKLEKKKEKYLRKTAKQVRKLDQKELKARRKHEETMAKTALEQIKAGRFNSANVLRYTAALRTLAPVAVPLAYRALNQLRSLSEGREASRHGVDRSSMGWVAGTGAPQRARIEDLRSRLRDGRGPAGFGRDARERLDQLESSLEHAGSMSDSQKRNLESSVSAELDLLDRQLKDTVASH